MDRTAASLEMVEEVQNQPEFPPKRIRFEEIRAEEAEDRISRLPDCLLSEILSRLPETKYAVRTGVLSKRWKDMWTSVPNLIFSQNRCNQTADFVSFVDKTLTQRSQSKLKKLEVYCYYNDRFESQVHNWIRYAINCDVEELSITFWSMECESEFLLDQYVSRASCLTNLSLWRCGFNLIGTTSWKKLRRLHISCTRLDEDLIENILSGSPVLETLLLQACYGFRQVNITSKSVKKLLFYDYSGPYENLSDEYADVIEINAPNILSLGITNNMLLLNLLLVNVSSLVEAELDYWKGGDNGGKTRKEAEEEMLKGFILNLGHVKKIEIGYYCFKVLSRLEAKGFIFPSNLKVCDDSYYSLDPDDESDDEW